MADEWALRDIGRAETVVRLGTVDYSNIEDQFNYQEFNLSNSQSSQSTQQIKMFPVEKWISHFESYAPVWEPVGELGCYKLHVNADPDAPKQTLIYGFLGPTSAVPDMAAAEADYYPSEYVDTGSDTVPASGTTPSTTPQSFAPPISPPSSAVESVPYIAVSALTRDIPFIPSSVDHLAPDAKKYINIIQENGIQIHNIWDIAEFYKKDNSLEYLKSVGPYWSGSNYAGATVSQGGEPGAYRIKVNANKGSLLLYRVAPMNRDIGYDSRYPWIFPYIDPLNGQVKHGLFEDYPSAIEDSGLFKNETRDKKGKTDNPNSGFHLNIDLSSEGPRGAFSDSGGGISQAINIMWGWDSKDPNQMFYPGNDNQFASSFSVSFANNKIPVLRYHNGKREVNVYLEDDPIEFSENTNLQLTVEYLGTSMLVRTAKSSRLISGALDDGSNNSIKGVWTKNPNISIFFAGCVATFDFMPVFYNPWYPAADITLTEPENIEIVDNFHKASDLNFNPNKPETGFAKLIIASAFNTYAAPESAKTILDSLYTSMLEAFDKQTYHPEDMKRSLENSLAQENKYKPESGWPQCILDIRNKQDISVMPKSNGEVNHAIVPVAKIYNIGFGVNSTTTPNSFGTSRMTPTAAIKDPMSSLSILWRINTTYTTPLIFGFKTHDIVTDANIIHAPMKDISEYVNSWSINWNSEQDFKILRASGSVTLLNPPGYIIDLISKNRMQIEISDTGYREYGNVVNLDIKPYIYRQECIFKGITVGSKLSFGPGGDVYFVIDCVDGLKLLEDYRLETNLRFDGVSYYMALSLLMQASDYAKLFKVEDFVNNNFLKHGWKQVWRGGPTIFSDVSRRPITWDTMLSGGYHYYSSMFFGYQPLSGRAHEVSSGTILFDALMEIIKNMHNPASLPLFYFRPRDGVFVLQIRDGEDNQLTSARRPKFKSEINSEDELKSYLPLLSIGNQEAYEMASDTQALTSHFTVTGTDRSTGVPIKATAISPFWKSLTDLNLTNPEYNNYSNGDPSSNLILGINEHQTKASEVYGHLGYKKRAYHAVGNFVVDMYGAYSYAMSRLWWLMRPAIHINNLTVYGVIDGLDDGLVSVDLTGLPYQKCLLKQSNISYDANEGTVISRCSVLVYPPWQSM